MWALHHQLSISNIYNDTIRNYNLSVLEEEVEGEEGIFARLLYFSKTGHYTFPWTNYTDDSNDDFDSQLKPAKDVSVDAVVSSLFFNTVVFITLMSSYEIMRRLLPAVYSSRQRLFHTMGNQQHHHHEGGTTTAATTTTDCDLSNEFYQNMSNNDDDDDFNNNNNGNARGIPEESCDDGGGEGGFEAGGDIDSQSESRDSFMLPDSAPLDWIGPVFGVSWSKVRKRAGLDGYFFLRYIRMCSRITAVTFIWAFVILVPIYATGKDQNNALGWYHISAANIHKDGWRMWVPIVFAYFFTAFILFVIEQEYRHFLQLRMDFLARGSDHVNPQHHYSLMVENIPCELRSDTALFDYFDKLFPGKVHSASVVLNLPDMEALSTRCMRVCRRLEKSIAYYHATHKRPTHVVGAKRISFLGIQLATLDFSCCSNKEVVYCDESHLERPERGTRVDSISYYTQDLAACNRFLKAMQSDKTQIAASGNISLQASNWLSKVIEKASEAAERIMDDSAEVNALQSSKSSLHYHGEIPQAEMMSSWYGSITAGQPNVSWNLSESFSSEDSISWTSKKRLVTESLGSGLKTEEDRPSSSLAENRKKTQEERPPRIPENREQFNCPAEELDGGSRITCRRLAGRLGLDFVVAGLRFFNRQLDVALEEVVGATMSSTGFVTLLDLSSVTSAASAPLTNKPKTLEVTIAPNPQEIRWGNVHVSRKTREQREQIVNVVLFLGVLIWSFPLAAIQAFAKAEFIAQIPGMEWIVTYQSGKMMSFVNGYLPVLALLILILILPVLFEYIAVRYERRKTFSDVQTSMLARYFYYQLANIYITVTAGSLWKSLANILDRPSNILQLLGESLPTMVGYFIAFLITKILAGLPMVFLRFGALSRMLFLLALSREKVLTQREVDEIYRPENVQYGWEFPSQLLVIVIVFTYAIICPVILPVGLVYFLGSLVVYKKQVLYVYTPIYESGGAMFPAAVQRTVIGLVCSQLTLLGYTVIRGCYYQPLVLIPLPVMTVYVMRYYNRHYARPSGLLSMERAREFDEMCDEQDMKRYGLDRNRTLRKDRRGTLQKQSSAAVGIAQRKLRFDKNSYRQPVLNQSAMEPLMYRRGQEDAMTRQARFDLRKASQFGGTFAPSSRSSDGSGLLV